MKSKIKSKTLSMRFPEIFISGQVTSLFLIVVSFLLLFITLIRPDAATNLRVYTTDITAPVLSFVGEPFQNMAEAIGSISGIAALRAENAKLKADNIRLKEWYQTALMLQAENKSLQDLLSLKADISASYISARVISDFKNAFVKTILINAGLDEGVKENQAVLSGEGMIGRVIEVGNNASRVLLLTDINSRIPVLVENSNQKAILTGKNSDLLFFKHIPRDSSLPDGARIVTSGDGGIFPPGLPVGRVVKDNQGIALVRPFSDMNRITYVRIMDSATATDKNLVLGTLGSSSN